MNVDVRLFVVAVFAVVTTVLGVAWVVLLPEGALGGSGLPPWAYPAAIVGMLAGIGLVGYMLAESLAWQTMSPPCGPFKMFVQFIGLNEIERGELNRLLVRRCAGFTALPESPMWDVGMLVSVSSAGGAALLAVCWWIAPAATMAALGVITVPGLVGVVTYRTVKPPKFAWRQHDKKIRLFWRRMTAEDALTLEKTLAEFIVRELAQVPSVRRLSGELSTEQLIDLGEHRATGALQDSVTMQVQGQGAAQSPVSAEGAAETVAPVTATAEALTQPPPKAVEVVRAAARSPQTETVPMFMVDDLCETCGKHPITGFLAGEGICKNCLAVALHVADAAKAVDPKPAPAPRGRRGLRSSFGDGIDPDTKQGSAAPQKSVKV